MIPKIENLDSLEFLKSKSDFSADITYKHNPNNSVLHGDCLELMKSVPDKSIDLVVTSPPYDNLRTYNGSLEWNFKIFKSIAKELYRVVKDGGVVVWVVGDATIKGSETGTSFKQALYFKALGFNLHDTMIYHSNKPPLTHNRYEQNFEYMFIFSKGKPKTFTPLKDVCKRAGAKNNRFLHSASIFDNSALRGRNEITTTKETKIKSNVWHYATGLNGSTKEKIAFQHPAIFPLQLATDHILSWSNEGDTILDPFAGSGTTAIACLDTNRNYILMEKEETYIDIINARIKHHYNNLEHSRKAISLFN